MRWVYVSAPLYSSKLSYWQESSAPLNSTLTDQNKTDLTRCAEAILLAREHYFPTTLAQPLCKRIADLYDRDRMDSEFPLVREAHDLLAATLRDRNDEILERIDRDRRCKTDTFVERSRRENAWKNSLTSTAK